MDKLSVIIPVRNRAIMLDRCLQSLEAQKYRPLQIIIVDNGSDDKTPEVASQWVRRFVDKGVEAVLLSELEPGATTARNTGARVADGDVIAFVDSDDTVRPDYAATIMRTFVENPKSEIVYWRKMGHWHDGTQRQFKFTRQASFASHIVHAVLDTMGCAVRHSLFIRCGGWNTSLPIWNDWEIGIRYLIFNTGETVRIDKILVDKYQHSESITGSSYLSRKGRYEISLAAALNDAGGNRILVTLIAYKTAILAAHYYREGDKERGHRTLKHACDLLSHPRQSIVLRMAFFYTAIGMRGAASWALPMLGIR